MNAMMTMKSANLHGLSVSNLHTRSHLSSILLIASPLVSTLYPHARSPKAKQALVKGRCTSVRLDYNAHVILLLTYVGTVTCDPVHQDVLRAWHPLIKTRKSVDVDVNSGDDTSSESHDDSKSTISEHTKKSSSSRSAIMAKSEDEVEQDIISVSSGIWSTLYF